MSDYIKREDAIRAIMEYIRDGCDESDEFIDGTYKAKLIVEEDIPSADVVEVRHGYWRNVGKAACQCSECDYLHLGNNAVQTTRLYKYCPNCGARMDGDEE